jgi:hypothetical protein
MMVCWDLLGVSSAGMSCVKSLYLWLLVPAELDRELRGS